MAKSRVKVRDRGLKKILRQVARADGLVASIGIQGSEAEADHDGLTNAELGAIHEFGVDVPGTRIPERSFVRVPFDQNQKAAVSLIGKRIKAGDSEEKALGLGAEFMRAKMVREIDRGIPPPLAESTVARKGSSRPLIDTGQLKQSITSKVRGK